MTTSPVYLAANYAADGEGGINAYSTDAARLKEAFLRDAMRYARSVGKYLADLGVTGHEYRKNLGGIAVSGEVYADFWVPDAPGGILLTIEGSCLRLPGTGRPSDGVLIRVQQFEWREHGGKKRLSHIVGSNRYFSPHLSSRDLALELMQFFGIAVPELMPAWAAQMSMF